MSKENLMPDWAMNVFEAIASAIEFKGPAEMEARFYDPDDTSWGIHLLEIAPALIELSERGPEDGAEVYGIIHHLDLLEVQSALDEVEAFSFGFENDGRLVLTLEGKVQEQEIAILIHTYPFDDAKASSIFRRK